MKTAKPSKATRFILLFCVVDMIFSEDAIIMSLLDRFEDEEDIKEEVLKYCKGGAISQDKHPEDTEDRKQDTA